MLAPVDDPLDRNASPLFLALELPAFELVHVRLPKILPVPHGEDG
jgi:hypothetical protein